MTVELTVRVFYTFRKWSGLYFWSVLITTWGVTLHAIGFILKICVPSCNWIFSTVLAEIGWVSMVSGFSVVLYSRLHLVVRNPRVLQLVLAMIITDAFLFHVPTIVFVGSTIILEIKSRCHLDDSANILNSNLAPVRNQRIKNISGSWDLWSAFKWQDSPSRK